MAPTGSIEKLQAIAASRGGKCLTPTYTTSKAKYWWECAKGHKWEAVATKVTFGTWCRDCAGNKPKDMSYLQSLAAKFGGKCLDTEYKGMSHKYTWECSKGHPPWEALATNVYSNHWCPACAGRPARDLAYLQEKAAALGGKLLSTKYINIDTKYDWECAKGHSLTCTGSDVVGGHWCRWCAATDSKPQAELSKIIQGWVGADAVVENDQTLLGDGKEIDIYLPKYKLAIEYCGLYFHGERKGRKSSSYHINKHKKCLEKDVTLLTVFSDEWLSKRETCLNIIRNGLGLDTQAIYARKTECVQIDFRAAKDFLDQHHLQGSVSGASWGLMFEGRLVAVMVTDKSRNSLYLKRYCVSTRVVGGFSKLLKYVVSNVHPQSVYTFSDNRWFDGNMYKSCGFTLEKELPPDYWYFKGESRRWHKSHYRKSKIEGILPEETEWQAMQRLKYDRIWDCGKKKWVLTF